MSNINVWVREDSSDQHWVENLMQEATGQPVKRMTTNEMHEKLRQAFSADLSESERNAIEDYFGMNRGYL